MHLCWKLFQTNLKITNRLSSKLIRVEKENVELGVGDWKFKDRIHSNHFFVKLDQVLNSFNKGAFAEDTILLKHLLSLLLVEHSFQFS
jgi:hypothetical protein